MAVVFLLFALYAVVDPVGAGQPWVLWGFLVIGVGVAVVRTALWKRRTARSHTGHDDAHDDDAPSS